ncbi:hypothetical protein KEC55_12550 [Burkholderia cepacia]|uniref:hypothetical protein n=1 Tax=Burkholderia cepacia TaxID=292 RepID=UPI00249DF619|nr:hypothetical protein [Burkholderia cepacia]WGY67671.1 hypothetical protein KEC55_12550 [Burkholderia cepacia]
MKFKKIAGLFGASGASDFAWRFAYILSVSIGLGVVLCIGPSLQTYLLSLLKSPEGGIYASAYGDNLIVFPTINSWVFSTGLIIFSILSLPIAVFLVRRNRLPRDIFVVAAIYFFVALSVADVVFKVMFPDPNNPVNLYECLISNAIGGPLVAGWLILALRFGSEVVDFSKSNVLILRGVAVAVPIIAGGLLSCGAYYICSLFFNPTTSRIEVSVNPAVTGLYVAKDERKGADKGKLDSTAVNFGVMTKPERFSGDFSAINPQKAMTIEWKKPDRPQQFRAAMHFYTGCGDVQAADGVGKEGGEAFSSINSLQISTDDGPAQLSVHSSGSDLASINMANSNGDMFWLDQDSKTKETTVARFTTSDSVILYSSSSDRLRILIVVDLVKTDALHNLHLTSRNVKMKINDVVYGLAVSIDKALDLNAKLSCKAVHRNVPLGAGENALPDMGATFGILVEIEPSSPSGTLYAERKNLMSIKNFSGWASISKLKPEVASQLSDSGHVEAMTFRGNVDSFKLNDSKIDATPFDNFVLQGKKIHGSIEPSGTLRLEGAVDALWRNQVRLNPTRWERLDTSVKLLLLSVAMTVFSSLFYVVANTLKKNVHLSAF